MAPCLEDCPTEVVGLIVDRLPLRDLCSLRLTCCTLAAKAQGTFKSFFRHKRVFLTHDSLRRLSECTTPGRLGQSLRTLTVSGVLTHTRTLRAKTRALHCSKQARDNAQRHLDMLLQRQAEIQELCRSGLDLTLLSQVFSNLAACGRSLSVSVNVAVYETDLERALPPARHRNRKTVWNAAAQTFQTVLQAIMATQIQIESLNVYRDDRCSIGCDKIMSECLPLVRLPSLKSLAISFSDRDIQHYEGDDETRSEVPEDEIDYDAIRTERSIRTTQAEAGANTNFTGLANFLKACPNLVYLDLHYYTLDAPVGVDWQRQKYLERIVEVAPLSHVQHLTIRGMHTSQQTLLALIERSPLRRLSLHRISLAGSWEPIFSHCTSSSGKIEELHFHDLYEGRQIIFGLPSEPIVRDPHKPWLCSNDSLNRTAAEVKKPILYHVPPYVQLPSNPYYNTKRTEKCRMYGPPRGW